MVHTIGFTRAYTDMIRQAAQLGYDGIELHLMDSDAVDKKAIITALKRTMLS
ncbi:MAG: hypothetical protein ACLVBJ_06370 [Pilosibacter sp.]